MTHKPVPEVGGQPCSACGMFSSNSRSCTRTVSSAYSVCCFDCLFQPRGLHMLSWCLIPEGLKSRLTPPCQVPQEQGLLRAVSPSLCPKFITPERSGVSFFLIFHTYSCLLYGTGMWLLLLGEHTAPFLCLDLWSNAFLNGFLESLFLLHPHILWIVTDLTSPTSH